MRSELESKVMVGTVVIRAESSRMGDEHCYEAQYIFNIYSFFVENNLKARKTIRIYATFILINFTKKCVNNKKNIVYFI